MPFAGYPREAMPTRLPFALKDYLALVDWTGRLLRKDKRGAISGVAPPILDRLAIKPKHWVFLAKNFESQTKGLVGCVFSIQQAAEKLGCPRSPGLTCLKPYFLNSNLLIFRTSPFAVLTFAAEIRPELRQLGETAKPAYS